MGCGIICVCCLLVCCWISKGNALVLPTAKYRLYSLRRMMPRKMARDVGGEDNFHPLSDSTNGTGIVTKEMFLRDLLQDPVVKTRKKGGSDGYRVLDNRDSLPFSVQVTTPDPYTHPDIKREKVQRVKKRRDSVEQVIASSLYSIGNDGNSVNSAETHLGEFQLDKHTTTGDLLEIGDKQYKVVRHKCQYKYAGGKRFVMVRKVLQVKELARLQTEEILARQWDKNAECDNF